MFNLVKDDFDDNMDDIMKSINKMLDVEEEKNEENNLYNWKKFSRKRYNISNFKKENESKNICNVYN